VNLADVDARVGAGDPTAMGDVLWADAAGDAGIDGVDDTDAVDPQAVIATTVAASSRARRTVRPSRGSAH
jgi:hypothetical protein